MNEARMSILKMIEDGKINADEGVKLLEAVSKTVAAPNKVKRNFDSADLQSSFEEKVKLFAKNMDDMGKELGKRLDSMGKDVEPKIRKVAQTIINKTGECVDEISSTFKSDGGGCDAAENCCEKAAEDIKECCENAAENIENCCSNDNNNNQ